jgi:S1-C subfamily serine protease
MWLTITAGEGKGLAVRVEGDRFLVGSGAECRLVIHDDGIDPMHALFRIDDSGDVEVQDLRTASGTFVNGTRIEGATAVGDGDEISIGSTVLAASRERPAEDEAAVEVAVPPEPAPADAGEDAVALVAAPEGTHVEVVPQRQRRRVRRATLVSAGAAIMAAIAVVAVVAVGAGGDDGPTTEEIVAAVTPSTVKVSVVGPSGGQGGGTGWVLDAPHGLIVTNYHVINAATQIRVDGQSSTGIANVVGAAPCEDLAVLKVDDTTGLRTLPMGTQRDVKLGEQVVALGYPVNASRDQRLISTAGVVSSVKTSFRFPSVQYPEYANVVQTDAALNPGNSGGPLVDRSKHLVGVNTAALESAGGTPITDQGYAIGVDRVRQVVGQLRQGRSRSWAGFGFAFASDREARKEKLPTKGVVISPALPGTGAAGAKIPARGALLLAVGGQPLEGTIADWCKKTGGIEPGQTVQATILDKVGAKPRTVPIRF